MPLQYIERPFEIVYARRQFDESNTLSRQPLMSCCQVPPTIFTSIFAVDHYAQNVAKSGQERLFGYSGRHFRSRDWTGLLGM